MRRIETVLWTLCLLFTFFVGDVTFVLGQEVKGKLKKVSRRPLTPEEIEEKKRLKELRAAEIAESERFLLKDQKINWLTWGLKVEDEKKEGDRVRLSLKYKEDEQPFQLSYQRKLDPRRLSDVIRIHKIFRKGKNMSVKNERYVLTEDNIEVLLGLKKLVCSNRDLLPYLPGNMFLTFATALEYKFRIHVDKLFLRIQGFYTTEEALCEKLISAIKDPEAYIQRNNPEFLRKRLDVLQAEVERLKLRAHLLSNAVLALENQGWFSGPELFNPELIRTVIDLRKANPTWSVEQIAEAVEKEGFSSSEKKIRLILLVHFNFIED